jgi:hypothetical protein
MPTGHRIEQLLLWLFVILAAIVIGGGLYEMRVVVPLWAQAPPESVWKFASERVNNPLYTPNSGLRFWIYVTPLHLLVSIVMIFVGLKTRGAHRRFVLMAAAIFALLHLSALLYFVPAIDKILTSQNSGMNPAEVVSRVHAWVYGSWLRFAIGLVGLICGLRAMQLPPGE